MNKRWVVFLMAFFAVLGFAQTGALAQDDPPDDIVIENEGYETDRKGPVEFSHLAHMEDYEIECMGCHHDYQDGKNVWDEGDSVEKCVSCHDPLKSEGNVKKLKTAYHKNCKKCHQDLAKEGISKEKTSE